MLIMCVHRAHTVKHTVHMGYTRGMSSTAVPIVIIKYGRYRIMNIDADVIAVIIK